MYYFMFFCMLATASAATVSLATAVLDNGNAVENGPRLKLYKNADSYYFFETAFKGNYFQATQFCNHLNMKLLSIETEEENKFVFETLRKIVDDDFYKFWTSGTRLGSSEWVWLSTGKNLTFQNWKPLEPNNQGGDEKCMEFYYDLKKFKTIVWNDKYCTAVQEFPICEFTPLNSVSFPNYTLVNTNNGVALV